MCEAVVDAKWKHKMNKLLVVISILIATLVASTGWSIENKFIVPAEVLSEWGYHSKSTNSQAQTKWEKTTFGEAKIYKQKIKAINQVKDWKDAYYRFTLIYELYNSEKDARNRINKLSHHPAGVNTKQQPEYLLRKGFRIRNSVYIVTTDVYKFEIEELPRIVELFKAYEQSKSIKMDNNSRDRVN